MGACPTCKSERCGNHAACERKAADKAINDARDYDKLASLEKQNQIMFAALVMREADKRGKKRGYPYTILEALKLSEELAREVAEEAVAKTMEQLGMTRAAKK